MKSKRKFESERAIDRKRSINRERQMSLPFTAKLKRERGGESKRVLLIEH